MSVRRIAQEAGVSIATVSRVLNNDPAVRPETREKVLAVANKTGYVPTMGRRAKNLIGFTYTQEMSLSHRFDSTVLEGIVSGADEAAFEVLIVNMQRDKKPEESYSQFFMRKGLRGVILRTNQQSREACIEIANEGFPHVVLAERFDEPQVCYLESESYPDSVRAVEYLISLGHRDIAFAMHNIPDRDHADRLQGYKDAIGRHGIAFREDRVFKYPWTMAGGATVMDMIMSMSPRPSAVYFADPMLAVGAIKRANETNVRVPDEISIVGFDDTDVRFSVHPTLTAICQDAATLGLEAARWLTRRLGENTNEPGALKRTIPTHFEVNQSSGPRPAESAA